MTVLIHQRGTRAAEAGVIWGAHPPVPPLIGLRLGTAGRDVLADSGRLDSAHRERRVRYECRLSKVMVRNKGRPVSWDTPSPPSPVRSGYDLTDAATNRSFL